MTSLDTPSGTKGPSPIAIYDSNGLNPYGAELAAVLAGYSLVEHWRPVSSNFDNGQARTFSRLAGLRAESGTLQAILRRVTGPAEIVLSHAFSKKILVFAWVSRLPDALSALVLTLLGRTVVIVDHDPTPGRGPTGITAKILDFLRIHASLVVVHSDRLTKSLPGRTRTAVVTHPSYQRWANHHGLASRELPASTSNTQVALLLGHFRADKGAGLFANIVRDLRAEGLRVLIAGQGYIPTDLADQISLDEGIRFWGGSRKLSDCEVAEAIRSSSVLVAPYDQVTASGTVILAQSCGLPVVAFDSVGMREHLSPSFLAPMGDTRALARLAYRHNRSTGELRSSQGDSRDLACARSWAQAIHRLAV